jgi:hypothetical protein
MPWAVPLSYPLTDTSIWYTILLMDSETSADIPKYEPEIIERAGLHVRLTRAHHDKLAMLVRETGRSRRDIIEMLIDKSKVAAYTE